MVFADEKLSVGDVADTTYNGKEVIHVKPIEDEDPYWNRWSYIDMDIIIG